MARSTSTRAATFHRRAGPARLKTESRGTVSAAAVRPRSGPASSSASAAAEPTSPIKRLRSDRVEEQDLLNRPEPVGEVERAHVVDLVVPADQRVHRPPGAAGTQIDLRLADQPKLLD